jgi:tetratricopeptide (TPR) repeat protein
MSIGTFTRALALAAALVAFSGLLPQARAVAAEEPKHTNSAKLAKPLKEAQEDLQKKKYDDAITKLKAAEGIEGKTAYDQHLINDFLTFAYVRTQDYADAAKTMEAEVDDGFLTAAEIPQKVRALAEVSYQIKNYDKAIEYGERAIKGGYGDDALKKLVGQAYYLKGDWKGTLRFEENVVDPVIKAGGTPPDQALELILSACVKMDDSKCTTKALEKLVAYYPKPDYWSNLLVGMIKETASSDTNTLQVFRLMLEVGVLKNADDYNEMAQLCMDAGSPGEAEHVIESGFAKNVFTDQRSKDKNTRLLQKAKQAAAVDQKTLAKTQQEADASATGAKDIGMGIAYLGYQQYDKAVSDFSQGIGKGGLRNPPEAQLMLGIAQLKAGHKDDAVKSFHSVKGDPILERLASLWALHAKQA